MFEKCEFCENWYLENVNFVKIRKNRDFRSENFVKNDTLRMWMLWKLRLWKCEFCEKWDFENVNFVINETLNMWISE